MRKAKNQNISTFYKIFDSLLKFQSFEEDPEPFGKVRDQNIMAMCKENGIKVVTEKSHTLFYLEK